MSDAFSLRTILGLPWWALQLVTGGKSFVDNPLIGSRRLNARDLHVARVKAASALAWARRRRLSAMVSAQHRAEFDANGFVMIADFLPQEQFDALRSAVLDHTAPTREMVQGDTVTRRIAIDAAFRKAVPNIAALIDAPVWRGLMRYVSSFDIEPLYYIQSILKRASDAPPDPQTVLHEDAFHPSMKAWFFLNDVAEDAGPFTYVPGSHQATPQRLAWEKARSLALPDSADRLSSRGSLRISAEEVEAMGLPPARGLAARANTLVVADTFGFHARGPSAGDLNRVEIWAYSRRNPFTPWLGLDLLSLPGIAERRIPALWAFRDRFERWIGQPWRNVGRKTPLDDRLG